MAGVLLTSGASPEKATAEPASVRATIERRISDHLYLLPFFFRDSHDTLRDPLHLLNGSLTQWRLAGSTAAVHELHAWRGGYC